MVKPRTFLLVCVTLPLLLGAFLQANITVQANTAEADFPNAVRFYLEAESNVEIQTVEIEFRTDALACGDGTTQATPEDFTPSKSVNVDWSWEFRRTGPIPPGTTVWWRWVFYDAESNRLFETPEQSLVLEDTAHTWQQIESEHLLLNWYSGDQDFAQTLVDAGESSINDLEAIFGITVDEKTRVYIYGSSTDMQNSTLFAPAWSGGLAYSQENALLMGVSLTDLDWGQRAIMHELTHVITGRVFYSCVKSTPTWFEEGFAMYMEGEPEPYYVDLVNQAIEENNLLSVRELGQIFSGNSELAGLSYAQSQSIVTFLVKEYGEEKLLEIEHQWQEGSSEDTALMEVYGVDRDGLESAWREWVGAPPMETQPEVAIATYTPYPTYQPISQPPEAVAEVWPTPNYLTEAPISADDAPGNPFDSQSQMVLFAAAGGVCLAGLGLLAVIVVVVVILRSRKPADPVV